jgi:hypothetical protein
MTIVLVRTVLYDGPPPWERPRGVDIVVRKHGWITSAISAAVSLDTDFGFTRSVTDEHLRAEPDETDPERLAVADVCVQSVTMKGTPSGCLTLATVARGRTYVMVRGEAVIDVSVSESPGVFASFVHSWKVSGRPLASLHGASLMTTGTSWRRIRFNRLPAAPGIF